MMGGERLVPDGKRIDHDMPREGDAYVIRIEAADGRRLMTRVSEAELAVKAPEERLRLIAAKSEQLARVIEINGGHIPPGFLRPAPDGHLIEVEPTDS